MSEKTILEYTIKIHRVYDRKKIGAGFENKDKMFLVDAMGYGGHGIGFAVPIKHYGKSLKKVFKEIQNNLHL
jgi:hypothetical protein